MVAAPLVSVAAGAVAGTGAKQTLSKPRRFKPMGLFLLPLRTPACRADANRLELRARGLTRTNICVELGAVSCRIDRLAGQQWLGGATRSRARLKGGLGAAAESPSCLWKVSCWRVWARHAERCSPRLLCEPPSWEVFFALLAGGGFVPPGIALLLAYPVPPAHQN